MMVLFCDKTERLKPLIIFEKEVRSKIPDSVLIHIVNVLILKLLE